MVAHTFNTSGPEAEAGGSLCEFKTSLIYSMWSSTTKDTQRNLDSKNKKIKKGLKKNVEAIIGPHTFLENTAS